MRWFLCARVCQGVGLRTLGEMFINRTYAVIERQEEQVNRVSGGVTKALLLCVPCLSCPPRFFFLVFHLAPVSRLCADVPMMCLW